MKPIAFAARYRNALLLVAALATGALAAFGARGYIAEQIAIERERLLPDAPKLQVIVAKRDLPRGEIVGAETMAVREVPRDYVPASAITPERFDGYAGARLVAPMRAGEPLLSGSVEGADPATFSAKVRSGIRAITVGVDEVNSLSGMLQPGDRIDLLLSVRLPSGAATPLAQEVTRPLMQDLRVLATGRQVRPGGDERNPRAFTAITVEVTPRQAQKLVVAQRIGKLTAMLRNPEDRGALDAGPMDVYGLLDMQPVPAAPPAPVVRPPEVIMGGLGPLRPPAPAVTGGSVFAATAGEHSTPSGTASTASPASTAHAGAQQADGAHAGAPQAAPPRVGASQSGNSPTQSQQLRHSR